jgi:hypothetical protein
MEFSMEFHGKFNANSMEFHGILCNFPWNSMEIFHEKKSSNVYEKFLGIPRDFP